MTPGGLREAGRLSEAEAPLRESVALYEKLVAEQPDDAESRSGRADAHNSLGGLLRDRGSREDAGAELRLGRELWGELYRANPEAIEPAFGYGRACRESARYFEARGEPGAALGSLDQAVGTLRSAHQREPRIAPVKQGLREALGKRAGPVRPRAAMPRPWPTGTRPSSSPRPSPETCSGCGGP